MPTSEQAIGISPWDLPTPRRPGIGDYNGAALEDDAEDVPDPETMPTADLMNGTAITELAIGQVVPHAVLSITFPGGSPAINIGTCAAGATPGSTSPIGSSSFSVARTSGGAGSGDVTISWAASVLPVAAAAPMATLNGTTPGLICADVTTVAGNAGVRIVTKNGSNVATDLPFTVAIY